MSIALDKLKSGDFQAMSQQWLTEHETIIELSARGEHKVYKLKVKDLYLPTEEVLEEEVIEV